MYASACPALPCFVLTASYNCRLQELHDREKVLQQQLTSAKAAVQDALAARDALRSQLDQQQQVSCWCM